MAGLQLIATCKRESNVDIWRQNGISFSTVCSLLNSVTVTAQEICADTWDGIGLEMRPSVFLHKDYIGNWKVSGTCRSSQEFSCFYYYFLLSFHVSDFELHTVNSITGRWESNAACQEYFAIQLQQLIASVIKLSVVSDLWDLGHLCNCWTISLPSLRNSIIIKGWNLIISKDRAQIQ